MKVAKKGEIRKVSLSVAIQPQVVMNNPPPHQFGVRSPGFGVRSLEFGIRSFKNSDSFISYYIRRMYIPHAVIIINNNNRFLS